MKYPSIPLQALSMKWKRDFFFHPMITTYIKFKYSCSFKFYLMMKFYTFNLTLGKHWLRGRLNELNFNVGEVQLVAKKVAVELYFYFCKQSVRKPKCKMLCSPFYRSASNGLIFRWMLEIIQEWNCSNIHLMD
jgi:hypothetical protein